jgi:hypothetical protein
MGRTRAETLAIARRKYAQNRSKELTQDPHPLDERLDLAGLITIPDPIDKHVVEKGRIKPRFILVKIYLKLANRFK